MNELADGGVEPHGRRWPRPLSALVTAQMKRMPRADTEPELALRGELHRRGLRFRVGVTELPGRPDIVFSRARLVVFVDGCFWHACPEHGTLPKNNRDWWRAKLDGNVARDRRKDERLVELGWLPLHIWEHTPTAAGADRVELLWRERVGREPARRA